MAGSLKLLTALGRQKELTLELVDFFNGGDRFRYKEEGEAARRLFSGRSIRDLYLVLTDEVETVFNELSQIMAGEYPEIIIHPIRLGCGDVTCLAVDGDVREIIYHETGAIAGSDLVIASGGRKMVTQRLIEAGLLFGCAGYFTITTDDDIEKGGNSRFQSEKFNIIWSPATGLYRERRRGVIRDDYREMGDTFRSLYLLPTSLVNELRQGRIGADQAREDEELAWLKKLPKTDLHCHLGGCYDFTILRELAATLLGDLEISAQRQQEIAEELASRLKTPLTYLCASGLRDLSPNAIHCLANLQELYTDIKEDTHVAHAVLVASLTEGQLADLATDGGREAGADPLEWYMKSGDLGGSNLLQTKNTLRRAVAWAIQHAVDDGVRYLEIRFSPGNYTRAGLGINEVVEIVRDQARITAEPLNITVNFLIMATRHKDEGEMDRHVKAAVAAFNRGPRKSRVVGFDLAGQEEDNPPERFQDIFEPLHRHFINVTIHAGEMADEEKIWQALYRLHAKRIGHGLKLENNRKMMDYVRDWGISLEMCPGSNRQTNGFRFFDRDDDGGVYPLKKYLDHGIRVTVNTDNPGISKTTASRELLLAARMTEGGLSRWDILRLVRNGLKASFLPRDEKDRLLKEADKRVFDLLLEEAG